MSWDAHPVGLRVIDLDGDRGEVIESHVTRLHPAWFMADSRRTKVRYDDGRIQDIAEFEDDQEPMLRPEVR